MCQRATRWGGVWIGVLVITFAAAVEAQDVGRPDWRHVGNSSVELMLASPVTGPVDAVWFSVDGSRLYARTRSGRVFESPDFESWAPSGAQVPPAERPITVVRLPAANVKLRQ